MTKSTYLHLLLYWLAYDYPLSLSLSPAVSIHTTKVEIRLTKEDTNIHWESVGTSLPGNDHMVANSNRG